jgi:hypothetical protein
MSDRRATCIASHRPDHHAGSRGAAMAIAKHTTATVIPALQYQDAPAVIDFLCKAFGGPRLDFRQLRCLG